VEENTAWLGRMPEFETELGTPILPDVHVVVRLQGDRFGRLYASEKLGLERPFDARMGKWLLQAASHALRENAEARFAYVGGDEISILFGQGPEGFGPGERFSLRLSARTTGRLSLLMGGVAAFYPRIYQFPSDDWMVRYFVWRQETLISFAVDRYCRWALGRSGLDEVATRRVLADLSDDDKVEILSEHGIDFSGTPIWQRRGALVWRRIDAGETALVIDTALPVGHAYDETVRRIATV